MNIVLLGSTGSIGQQTLDVARRHKINITAIAAKSNIRLLEEQAREFKPQYVCIYDEVYYNDMKTRLADTGIKILCGKTGLCESAAINCDTVVNAVVGMAGLEPTLSAIGAGNKVALANKETLAAGGELVMARAKANNVDIIPVDSEHSAIFQCLSGNTNNSFTKIILTASGGAFFNYSRDMLRTVTREQALRHPNWDMGAKVTVDSATLMNKGLEFIEAMRLFDAQPEQIEVVIHRQSIVHSAVEFADGSVIAQMGTPDMRVPIQYALTHPERLDTGAKRLSFTELGSLTFEKPDEEVFTCLAAVKRAAGTGNNACAVVNAANEAAVEAFLAGQIPFYKISELVTSASENVKANNIVNLETIYEDSSAATEHVKGQIN